MRALLAVVLVVSVIELVSSTGEIRDIPIENLKWERFYIHHIIRHYNIRVNSRYHHVLYDIDRAQVQSVEGSLYRFHATYIPTVCEKNTSKDYFKMFNNCKPVQGMHATTCNVTIWSRPWLFGALGEDGANQVNFEDCQPTPSLARLHGNVFLFGLLDDWIGTRDHFKQFKETHGKVYNSKEEDTRRYSIFNENMRKAITLSLLELGSGHYGITPFADLTEEEFRRSHLSSGWDTNNRPQKQASIPRTVQIPSRFDWRQQGAVTPVKNQEQCGSCWAFSTTGNIEGQWFIAKKQLISLSEQELVDCDKLDSGCNGGLPSNAYKEIQRLGGLMAENDYPYKALDGTCTFSKPAVKAYINGSVAISSNETEMAAWLAQSGPISIGINAFAMQFYMGGVSHPWSIFCNKAKLDHGVLIVGYNATETGEPYWIVKNSWGPTWGDKGYYLVYRGDGTCGLNTMCTSAVVN